VRELYEDIGKRLKHARDRAGLSQQKVADRIGLSDVGYGGFERADRQISIEYLFALSEILGQSVSWLLGLDTGLTTEEDELLTCFRTTNDPGREAILTVARSMAREHPRPGSGS